MLDSLVGLVSMRMPMLLLLDRIGKDMRMLFVQDASAKLNCCEDTYLFTKHRCKLLVKAETGLGRGPLHRDDMINIMVLVVKDSSTSRKVGLALLKQYLRMKH